MPGMVATPGTLEHSLASTWRCGPRSPSSPSERPRHTYQAPLEVLSRADPDAAAEEMRRHMADSMQRTLEYFKLRKKSGKTCLRGSTKNNSRPGWPRRWSNSANAGARPAGMSAAAGSPVLFGTGRGRVSYNAG